MPDDGIQPAMRRRLGEHPLLAAARAFAGRMVYGAIIILAVILALDAGRIYGAGEVTLLIVLATMAVAFAELYSEIVGETIRRRRSLTRGELHQITVNLGAILLVPVPPFVLIALSALGVMSLRTAVVMSAWLLVGILFTFGYVAFREAGRSRPWSLGGASVLLGVGLLMVAFKFLVTH